MKTTLEPAIANLSFPVWFVVQDGDVKATELTERNARSFLSYYKPRTGGKPYIVQATATATIDSVEVE